MKRKLAMLGAGPDVTKPSKFKGFRKRSKCKSPTPVIVKRPLKRLVAAVLHARGEKEARKVVGCFGPLSRLPNHILADYIEQEVFA